MIDGARSKWCHLLLVNAIVGILDFQSFNLAARRKFNQQQILCDCINSEIGEVYSDSFSSEIPVHAVLDQHWLDVGSLRQFLEQNAPYKSKEKYLGILDILLSHKAIEALNFDMERCINVAITKILSNTNRKVGRRPVPRSFSTPRLVAARVITVVAPATAATSRRPPPRSDAPKRSAAKAVRRATKYRRSVSSVHASPRPHNSAATATGTALQSRELYDSDDSRCDPHQRDEEREFEQQQQQRALELECDDDDDDDDDDVGDDDEQQHGQDHEDGTKKQYSFDRESVFGADGCDGDGELDGPDAQPWELLDSLPEAGAGAGGASSRPGDGVGIGSEVDGRTKSNGSASSFPAQRLHRSPCHSSLYFLNSGGRGAFSRGCVDSHDGGSFSLVVPQDTCLVLLPFPDSELTHTLRTNPFPIDGEGCSSSGGYSAGTSVRHNMRRGMGSSGVFF